MTKKELIEKTDRQIFYIGKEMTKLEKNLLSMTQITFRRKYLTVLGLYSLTLILNKVKGILYSANVFCEEFLLETGKEAAKEYEKKSRNQRRGN